MHVCMSVCLSAGGCGAVRGVLLARAAGDVVWQRETHQVPPQAGEHPHGGAERLHDALQELLRITLHAAAVPIRDVTGSSQQY